MSLRVLCILLLASVSMTACAQTDSGAADDKATDQAAASKGAAQSPPGAKASGTPAANATAALKKVNPNIVPERLGDAPLPGYQQAVVSGQVIFISNDGRYLIQGAVFDIDAKKNLGEAAMASVRRELIRSVPGQDRIVFAPKDPRYTVTVFTDVECGFCRRFHDDIANYNRQGIAVEYLAFPRMGPASEDFKIMEAVWCAKDRRQALSDAKKDRKVPATARCTSPVARQYNLGQRAGLTGTPMILAEDGTMLGGYLPPAELRAALDRHAAEVAKSGAASGGR